MKLGTVALAVLATIMLAASAAQAVPTQSFFF